jgi:hypothetical protein
VLTLVAAIANSRMDSLADADSEADPLVVVDCAAADSLLESEDVVEPLVDSDAADSLVLCDVDSVAESLVALVLPGVRTVLASVATVFRLVAVTSYETGVMSDMTYSPSSPPTLTDRVITVDLQPLGPDLQQWACCGGRPGQCREHH